MTVDDDGTIYRIEFKHYPCKPEKGKIKKVVCNIFRRGEPTEKGWKWLPVARGFSTVHKLDQNRYTNKQLRHFGLQKSFARASQAAELPRAVRLDVQDRLASQWGGAIHSPEPQSS